MTFCKHTQNRIVPIRYEKSIDNFFVSADDFSIFLIKKGSAVLNLNKKDCFLGDRTIICTNNLDKIDFIYQSELVVDVLHFAPTFINVNLSWDIIRKPDYRTLCEKHDYPKFLPFLKRSPIYNGILILDKNGYAKISDLMNLIDHQLSDQPDVKWSCRSRSFLFQTIDILNFYYHKYAGSYPQDDLVNDICQYINLNLASTLSLDLFRKLFSVNRTTLSERFKKTVGTTISEYIKEARISHIKHLLAFTELSLSEIGTQAGFHDQTYLSKVFLKAVGTTPLKYRSMVKETRLQNRK